MLFLRPNPSQKSVMRRQLVAQIARRAGVAARLLLAQLLQLVQQRINLQLLAVDRHVQLLQQVFAVAGFDFQLGQALLGVREGVAVGVAVGVHSGRLDRSFCGAWHCPPTKFLMKTASSPLNTGASSYQ